MWLVPSVVVLGGLLGYCATMLLLTTVRGHRRLRVRFLVATIALIALLFWVSEQFASLLPLEKALS